MATGSFAKEEVMEEYLSALLTEQTPADQVQRDTVKQLLSTAVEQLPEQPVVDIPPQVPAVAEEIDIKETPVDADKINADVEPAATEVDVSYREQAFQALFFEVAGLKLAVPLIQLGGIHQLEKIGPLFGKPAWFKGVMLHREEKLSVVDTARWVMPEKYNEKLADSLNYQYLIMLDKSHWGLACERLITTETLQPDDVKWRESDGKRPWLGGMVKKKMCALVNVDQLIQLLDRGMGSNED